MRLWTVQGIEIYDQLVRDGVTYCTKPSWDHDDRFMYAYHWIAEQMPFTDNRTQTYLCPNRGALRCELALGYQ